MFKKILLTPDFWTVVYFIILLFYILFKPMNFKYWIDRMLSIKCFFFVFVFLDLYEVIHILPYTQ